MSERIIEVRIEELTLEGVGPADRDRVAAAAYRELERLLGREAAWAGGPAFVVELDAGEVAPAGGGPESVGEGIARAIHGRLVR